MAKLNSAIKKTKTLLERQVEILIVDETKDLLYTLALILKRKGYYVDIANNELEALKILGLRHFDIVIIDVKTACINHSEVIHKIRYINPELRVILIAAHNEEIKIYNLPGEGGYEVLYKPISITELNELVSTK